jgi:hypothetical protein
MTVLADCATVTDIGVVRIAILSLAFCVLSPTNVHARTRKFDCVASVNVSSTSSPLATALVHTVPEPEPDAVIALAMPAAKHAGDKGIGATPLLKHNHTFPAMYPVYAAVSADP